MKIYTKTGDEGMTSLIGGERVSKADARVEAYGTVDELAAHLGLLGDFIEDGFPAITDQIAQIQNDLMRVMEVLASQESSVKSQESATRKSLRHMSHQGLITHNSSLMTDKLEGFMDSFDTRFTGFVVPGGDKKISQAHVCRTVCRRAERRAVAAGAGAEVLQYLNRLSDWCFAVSTFFVSFAIRK